MTRPAITPGPWVASDRHHHHEIYAAAYPGRPIAHADSYWQGPGPNAEERDANAKAIAAVPQLVEALLEVRLLFGPESTSRNLRAREVIDTALKAAGVTP